MANILLYIAYFAITIALMLVFLTLGRKYVFSKVRVNKWIILSISIILLMVQLFTKPSNIWVTMALSLIVVWFFLWFFDIHSTGGPKKKENKIEIRPKAKPNRAKHIQNQKNK